MRKKFNNKYYKKAKVVKDKNLQLRVLYKKVGHTPQVKIIKDISNFKRAIVLNKLDIIPYKKVFIICNNQDCKMPINVFFSLYHITGNLIVINIDKNEREFKSLSQEQLLYYSKDLLGREPNNITNDNNYSTKTKITKNGNVIPYEREFETDYSQSKQTDFKIYNSQIGQSKFEKTLISILVNIELTLASLLKNNMNGDDKNDE